MNTLKMLSLLGILIFTAINAFAADARDEGSSEEDTSDFCEPEPSFAEWARERYPTATDFVNNVKYGWPACSGLKTDADLQKHWEGKTGTRDPENS